MNTLLLSVIDSNDRAAQHETGVRLYSVNQLRLIEALCTFVIFSDVSKVLFTVILHNPLLSVRFEIEVVPSDRKLWKDCLRNKLNVIIAEKLSDASLSLCPAHRTPTPSELDHPECPPEHVPLNAFPFPLSFGPFLEEYPSSLLGPLHAYLLESNFLCSIRFVALSDLLEREMEPFKRLGFQEIPDDVKDRLNDLNSTVTPHLYRYQGMGHYDVLIEHENGFLILDQGGENGWTVEANNREYAAINDKTRFYSIERLLDSIGHGSWREIVSEERGDGVTCQQVITVNPHVEIPR